MTTAHESPRYFFVLRKLGIVLLLSLPAAIIIVRSGAWQAGLMLYAAACLLSTLLLVLCVGLSFVPSHRSRRKVLQHSAILSLPGALLLAVTVAGRGDYPPIHDISTDLEQVPAFSHAPALRGQEANSLDASPETRALQRAAYPELGPLITTLPPRAAWQRALASAGELGWDITYQGPRQQSLEAVASTPIMGFKDDIVIRLRATQDGTRIDLRSVSRVGVSDLGANAKRIRAFQQQFNAQE